ncbi:4-coumarate-CoA ligase [Heterostelium album PN500]|uniref:4-coumarate-CoA ligase n=1 Tax=Heterostelium pallidum (strain ATCC 26659 / Pp 5 / PN500) TaxID=670386 RepID=D3BND6_HETP5|nr:4-coumarate-CoA ligase [Heterostelium album PN500]EFA76796.1 4-coumarate-CoA ligase [Heterostelium album PN500]|eukprot:XP_020428928.1 4-coumarate-CoA ligase [Heterostelium album PN500]
MIKVENFELNSDKYFYSTFPEISIPDQSLTSYLLPYLQRHGKKTITIDGVTGREYSGLEIKSNIEKVASFLTKLGLKKGDVVGVILQNVPEYLMIFHGILLIGCVASTITGDYQIEEIKKTIGTVNPKLLITQSIFQDKIAGITKEIPSIQNVVVVGDVIPNTIPFQTALDTPINYPNVKINSYEDLAVLPFSSGTTGLPKGVMLTHRNLLSNMLQIQAVESPTYTYNEVVIGVIPYFHIYGMIFFLCVCVKAGISSVSLPRFDALSFLKLIEKYKVTITFIAPPVAILFAKSPVVDKFDISSLRVLFSGAAPLSVSVENAIKQRFGGRIHIKQAYGLSEASPAIVITPYGANKPGTSGMLLPNQVLKIQDIATGEIKGAGELGEICVRGPNIMKGYFNNPKATAEMIDADRFLHTGDVGRIDKDGYLYIEDRVKELIKYKGFQVAPAELEGLLLKHEKISDVGVIGIADEVSGELPRAYVVKQANQQVTVEEIQTWLNGQIAHYKRLRGGIIFIDQIPRSSSGKILRRELKAKVLSLEQSKL